EVFVGRYFSNIFFRTDAALSVSGAAGSSALACICLLSESLKKQKGEPELSFQHNFKFYDNTLC
ncbi:hypothetical protein K6U71_18055, partial [Vibrio alginolyticus]|nr:hypothetical protein [Vibrio alginolyticus]